MNDFIIKVCGITELSIARFLIQNNIDLMGFIFYPESPRYISIEKAKHILNKLGDKRKNIKVAGVFVNENIDKVLSISQTLSLDFIQLHGDESPDYINKLKSVKQQPEVLKQHTIIKAFRVGEDFNENEISRYQDKNIKYFLTDTFHKDKMGGTGKTFQWEKFSFLKDIPNIIISGGLNKDNVQQAIEYFHPAGIDLNSGVEKMPGIKSKNKIEAIMNIIKNYLPPGH